MAVKLSSPWQIYYKQICALFQADPEITIKFNEDEYRIVLLVDDPAKAEAIGLILPSVKTFGNVAVQIEVIPSNKNASASNVIKAAFKGNPNVREITDLTTPDRTKLTCVVFNKRVVQYFGDNMLTPNGLFSTLHEHIARDILENLNPSVVYCTDTVDPCDR